MFNSYQILKKKQAYISICIVAHYGFPADSQYFRINKQTTASLRLILGRLNDLLVYLNFNDTSLALMFNCVKLSNTAVYFNSKQFWRWYITSVAAGFLNLVYRPVLWTKHVPETKPVSVIKRLRLAFYSGPNWVDASPTFHLEVETESISETMCIYVALFKSRNPES